MIINYKKKKRHPADNREKLKESGKKNMYLDPLEKLRKLWNRKLT